MYDEGYQNIYNIDCSYTVIGAMEDAYRVKYPKMDFRVMNVLDLSDIIDKKFDIVIDKGTLDCVLVLT